MKKDNLVTLFSLYLTGQSDDSDLLQSASSQFSNDNVLAPRPSLRGQSPPRADCAEPGAPEGMYLLKTIFSLYYLYYYNTKLHSERAGTLTNKLSH